jgi:hypothetical protein
MWGFTGRKYLREQRVGKVAERQPYVIDVVVPVKAGQWVIIRRWIIQVSPQAAAIPERT